ncbi:MerR family DNA-binding transcriptional regulator [Streptomyces sp. LN590]|uniref:MerR family DNA-binding transcriptional regulator n=1 Tax=unclassified Streptomyces TaxID=2593676 RepID=UPI003724298E
MAWPIAEVARMSGVTARTLRHYDDRPGSAPTVTATTRSNNCCGCNRSSYSAYWPGAAPRSAGSWRRRSMSWRPCAAIGVGCSQSVNRLDALAGAVSRTGRPGCRRACTEVGYVVLACMQ